MVCDPRESKIRAESPRSRNPPQSEEHPPPPWKPVDPENVPERVGLWHPRRDSNLCVCVCVLLNSVVVVCEV